MGRIGQGLREHYEVATQITLARKLDDDRDWLFPSASWQNDPDFVRRLK